KGLPTRKIFQRRSCASAPSKRRRKRAAPKNRVRPQFPEMAQDGVLSKGDGHGESRAARQPREEETQTTETAGRAAQADARADQVTPGMEVRGTVDAVYRTESRRVFATLVRLLGDFELAEEALSEAFRAALEQWPREGVPGNPRAWLVSTGRFKAI